MVVTVAEALKAFKLSREAEFVSDATLSWYGYMLQRLERHLGQRLLGEVSTESIQQYVASIRREENAGHIRRETSRGLIRAMKNFFNWCELEYRHNPALRVKIPRSLREPPKAMTLETIRRLVQATDNTPMGFRDRAIIYFLLDTGCRAGGLLHLRMEDVNLELRRAQVTEKGKHSRMVPFTRSTGRHLRAWMAVCPRGAERLFCSMRRGDVGQPLTNSGVRLILKRLAQRAGVKERVFVHAFRHTFGTQYTRAGGPSLMLQQVMGHQDMRTTQRYVGVDEDMLSDLHERYSPVKKLEDMP